MASELDETRQLIEKATKGAELARLATLLLEANGGTAKDAERAAAKMADRISVYGHTAYVVDAEGAESTLEALADEVIGNTQTDPAKAMSEQARRVAGGDNEEIAAKLASMHYGI